MFIAQLLVGPSEQRQIIQTEHNIVKNPNWQEANQLAIYKRGRGFKLGENEKQIQVVVREGLEPLDCESDTLTIRPRCLHFDILAKGKIKQTAIAKSKRPYLFKNLRQLSSRKGKADALLVRFYSLRYLLNLGSRPLTIAIY